jgi:hypothetical protein
MAEARVRERIKTMASERNVVNHADLRVGERPAFPVFVKEDHP